MPEAKQRHLTSVRRLAAIMFTDIVGYTKMMSKDEQSTLNTLRVNRETHKKLILEYGGQFLKEMGDGTLASFDNSSDAVICAAAIQKASLESKIELRIGIHMGEVTFENNDVFGDGVNIASRIQPLAETNQIMISETVQHNVQNKSGITTTLVGQRELKNVLKPVVIYVVEVEDKFLTPGARSEKKKSVVPLILTIAVIAIIVFSTGSYWFGLEAREAPKKSPVIRYTIDIAAWLNRIGRHALAFSPDGKSLAYLINGQIYLKAMDETGIGLPITEVDDPRELFFSPDGKWVGFEDTNDARLMKVPVTGGKPQLICAVEGGVMGASWYENWIIFGQGRAFYKVKANGGTPEKIYPKDTSTFANYVWNPQLLPDNSILYNQMSQDEKSWDVRTVQLDNNREPQVLIDRGQDARYLEEGYIAYLKDGGLQIVQFDVESKSIGPPHLLTSDPILNLFNRAGQFVFNHHGTLVYRSEFDFTEKERHLAWIDFSGKTERITREPAMLMSPAISRDGRKIVVDLKTGEDYQLAVYNPVLGTATNLLTHSSSITPVWAPDNVSITYSQIGDSPGVYMKPVDLSYAEKLLFTTDKGELKLGNWSDDGRYLVFHDRDIGYFDRLDSAVHYLDFINTDDAVEIRPSISPDGKWLAYTSRSNNESNVYVVPFPGPGQTHRISIDWGDAPIWDPDMKAIYFIGYNDIGDNVTRALIETEPEFSSLAPEVLFYGEYTSFYQFGGGKFDIDPDGDRFLMQELMPRNVENIASEVKLKVVVNWQELLNDK